LESKSSDLATPSYLDQSRPNLKVWTPPIRLNLMAVGQQILSLKTAIASVGADIHKKALEFMRRNNLNLVMIDSRGRPKW